MKKRKLTMKRLINVGIFSTIFLFGGALAFGQTEGDTLKKPSHYDQEDDVFEEKRTVDAETDKSSAKAPAKEMDVDDMAKKNYNQKYWSKKYDERKMTKPAEAMRQETAQTQEEGMLGETQKKKEKKLDEIYDIVMEHPDFTYEYEYGTDGKLEGVDIVGVEEEQDREELAVLLVDLYELNKQLMNQPSPEGAFYMTEDEAEPKQGYRDFYDQLYSNLSYPQEAENRGVEGTMYVKFIVDDKGEINNLQVDHDIETPYTQVVEELEASAKEAVKATSGQWEPATINGQKVSEYVVIPVNFDWNVNPALKAPVR